MFYYLDKEKLGEHRAYCYGITDEADLELAKLYYEFEGSSLPSSPFFENGILREATRLERILLGRELPGYMEYLLDGELHTKPEIPLEMLRPVWDMETLEWKETATEDEIREHREEMEKREEFNNLPGVVKELDDRLYMTQDMLDEIVFGMMMTRNLTMEEREVNTQAIYYYDRIEQKEKREGVTAAKNYYAMVVEKFPQYKADIDFLLTENNKEYLIAA